MHVDGRRPLARASRAARADVGRQLEARAATRRARACRASRRPARARSRRCCRRRRTRACGPRESPQLLAQRQHVGQRLARMLLVGERVDDVQARRRGGELAQPRLRERAHDRAAHPALEVARDVVDRLAAAERDVAPAARSTSPPSSRTAIVKVERVRSDGFSKSSATCWPASGWSCRAAPARARASARAASVEHALELVGRRGRAPTGSPCVATRRRACVRRSAPVNASHRLRPVPGPHVRYSALMRTYSALKSQVHIVAACGPPVPRSTRDGRRPCPASIGRRGGRAFVVRHAGHEERHGADRDRRAVEHERRARSAGGRDEPAPVRVAAVNRRLDERRVGDRPRREPGVVVRSPRR